MSRVLVVAGVRDELSEVLTEALSATASECRLVEPGDLETPAAGDTVIYNAAAGLAPGAGPDLAVAERLFEVAAGAQHLIVLSSAAVHEPNSHHAGHVSESHLAALRHGNAIARAWRRLEAAADRAVDKARTILTLLRPTAVVARGGSDYLSRLLAGRLAFVPLGFDPSLQLLASDDLGRAVARVAQKGAAAAGVYHLAPRSVIPLTKALRAARCLRLPMPLAVQRLVRKVLGRRLAAPIDQLEYLRYPWTVSSEKIRRDLDFEPRFSSAEAVRALTGAPTREPASDRSARDASFDAFGMDPGYVARLGRTLFRFMHDVWWRVEWQGLEHIPRDGRAVLAGVHRGHQPWDGVMTFHLLVRELGRYPRYLIHPTLAKFPFLAPYMIKCGGIHACRENAAWVLERDGLLAIFPEGIRGAFTMYRDAYKLGKFGRDEYVKIALEHQAPIIPYVTVGSAEIFPILGRINWKWWKRVSEWPFLPITPTMGTVPLPSKWHTLFLEPIPVDAYPADAANDRATVRAISAMVRGRMEAALAELLQRRKSIWWGSVFDDGKPPVLGKEAA